MAQIALSSTFGVYYFLSSCPTGPWASQVTSGPTFITITCFSHPWIHGKQVVTVHRTIRQAVQYCEFLIRIVRSNLRNHGCLFRSCCEFRCTAEGPYHDLPCLVSPSSVSCYASLLPRRGLKKHTLRLHRSRTPKGVGSVFGMGSFIIPLIVSRTPEKATYSQVYHDDWTDKNLATVETGESL